MISAYVFNQHACIIATLPWESRDFQGKHQPNAELESLVRVGLASKTSAPVKPGPFDWIPGKSQRTVPGLRYELTKDGAKYVHDDARVSAMSFMTGRSHRLCYADEKLVDVTRWTEPSAAFGQTVTQVTYTYKLVNVAKWAKDPDVERAFHTEHDLMAAEMPRESKISLVLMNDGWRVPESAF